MNLSIVPLLLVVLFAGFTQSLAGFGSALMAMPLLATLFGLRVATPLVALLVIVLEIVLFIHFRHAFNLRVVWKLILSSLVGIPLGLSLLGRFDEALLLRPLGVIVIAYALYALIEIRMPRLQHPTWAFLFGFISGLFGGAYNTGGPPVIIFGNIRRWEPPEFKANLQGFFLVSSLWIAAGHVIRGNITPEIWRLFWPSTLALAFGIWAGLKLEHRIDTETFRSIVLWLLLVLGVSLFI